MKQKLDTALNEISDKHITEAAKTKFHRYIPKWEKAVATAAVLALVLGILGPSMSLRAAAVAEAKYPEYQYTPMDRDDALRMRDFFGDSISATLSGLNGENGAYSPLNLAIGLSVLAELSCSDGQQQILDAMGASSIDTLRSRANTMWKASYYDKNNQTLLANSLWLDNSITFNQDVMDTLASNYYTSVYRGNLGSSRVNRQIAQWLDRQTGNMLKKDTGAVSLSPDTVLALYSTIYYQAKWSIEFSASNNKDGIFHGANGDLTVTYMNKNKMTGTYYWAEDFGAITLYMKDGATMWIFLPDQDKTVEDVLASEDYLDVIYHQSENAKPMFINLSIPKFDIRQNSNLRSSLESMGITAIFDQDANAFANSIYGTDVFLSSANQATRVAIDEKGVTAASYIEFPGATSPAPPDDEIDFILDRPFFFVITRSNLPLFAGVVNEP